MVRPRRRPRPDRPQLVTEARPPLSADIAYRQRRYLIMMGIRTVCFVGAVLVYVNHGGWLTVMPLVAAIFIPYFAVVFANGGREPTATRGFREYEPSLPARYSPTPAAPPARDGNSGNIGAPSQTHTPRQETGHPDPS